MRYNIDIKNQDIRTRICLHGCSALNLRHSFCIMKAVYFVSKGRYGMTERSITSLTSQDGRITGLDGLRSLAIMGVTFFHLFPQQLRGGYLGVSLFFVLTGFLLAYTSEKSARLRDFSLKEYVIKRLKRIYPSLILMLLTTLGVFLYAGADGPGRDADGAPFSSIGI